MQEWVNLSFFFYAASEAAHLPSRCPGSPEVRSLQTRWNRLKHKTGTFKETKFQSKKNTIYKSICVFLLKVSLRFIFWSNLQYLLTNLKHKKLIQIAFKKVLLFRVCFYFMRNIHMDFNQTLADAAATATARDATIFDVKPNCMSYHWTTLWGKWIIPSLLHTGMFTLKVSNT